MVQQQTMPVETHKMPRNPKAIDVLGQSFVVSGKFLKTASLEREYQEDVADPEETARALKAHRVDILKFWQRVPDSEAKFNYYKEWRQIAALPVSTYQHWWEKQVTQKVRNKVRKARKQGVVVNEVPFSDDLVRGAVGIFNHAPIRRGKPMRHYGKTFEVAKVELGMELSESVFVAAHYQNELIGFIKFIVTDRSAMMSVILDNTDHRDKAPMNGMLAKVVEICVERKIPYFTYTLWRRGEHGHFQQSNGFVKFPVPEYFVPLTFKGRMALMLRLHRGMKGVLPEKVYGGLVDMRAKWNTLRYARNQ
jgi:hypothetical protein